VEDRPVFISDVAKGEAFLKLGTLSAQTGVNWRYTLSGRVGIHVKPNPETPFLPLDTPPINLKTRSFLLNDLKRLHTLPDTPFILNLQLMIILVPP